MSSKLQELFDNMDSVLLDSLPDNDKIEVEALMNQGYTLVEALEALDLI